MGYISADNYAFYLLKSGGHQVRALAPNLLRLCLHRPRWRGVLLYFKVSGTFTPTLLTSRLREFSFPLFCLSFCQDIRFWRTF